MMAIYHFQWLPSVPTVLLLLLLLLVIIHICAPTTTMTMVFAFLGQSKESWIIYGHSHITLCYEYVRALPAILISNGHLG